MARQEDATKTLPASARHSSTKSYSAPSVLFRRKSRSKPSLIFSSCRTRSGHVFRRSVSLLTAPSSSASDINATRHNATFDCPVNATYAATTNHSLPRPPVFNVAKCPLADANELSALLLQLSGREDATPAEFAIIMADINMYVTKLWLDYGVHDRKKLQDLLKLLRCYYDSKCTLRMLLDKAVEIFQRDNPRDAEALSGLARFLPPNIHFLQPPPRVAP